MTIIDDKVVTGIGAGSSSVEKALSSFAHTGQHIRVVLRNPILIDAVKENGRFEVPASQDPLQTFGCRLCNLSRGFRRGYDQSLPSRRIRLFCVQLECSVLVHVIEAGRSSEIDWSRHDQGIAVPHILQHRDQVILKRTWSPLLAVMAALAVSETELVQEMNVPVSILDGISRFYR